MRTLLLVDDEPPIHFTVGQVFADQPVRVLSAETADEALRLVPEEQPEVVLLDIRLGQRSGLKLFHELRRIDPKLLVIFITGPWSQGREPLAASTRWTRAGFGSSRRGNRPQGRQGDTGGDLHPGGGPDHFGHF
jgi:CheY-like chemotaxis protein